MLFNKAMIGLFIFTLSLSWIQAISIEKKEKKLSLPEDVSRLVTQNSTSELTSADSSASKSITSTEDNFLFEEDYITDDDLLEESSNIEDYLLEGSSNSSIDASGVDSNDTDGSYPEEYYDNEDSSSADNEFDASGDDDLDVTSPLSVTTTKDFIFEKPASTTVANEDATEKAASADQATSCTIFIIISILAVILSVILFTLLNIYCAPHKATQEKDSADQTFITVDKFMITENET